MAKKKDPELREVSPKGTAMYPFLFKPCTNFNKEEFKITLVLNLADPGVKEYLKKIADFTKKHSSGSKMPFKIDKAEGTATIRFHTKNAPMVVDAKKNHITEDPKMGNGSVIRVAGVFKPFDGFGGGATAYLNKVQVVELVEYIPGADEFDEEDGFTSDSTDTSGDFDDEKAAEDSTDIDDFGADSEAEGEGEDDLAF